MLLKTQHNTCVINRHTKSDILYTITNNIIHSVLACKKNTVLSAYVVLDKISIWTIKYIFSQRYFWALFCNIVLYCNIQTTNKHCFIKGLPQNLNLDTNLKLKYNMKSLNYIQPNFRFQASFLYYWTMSFTFSTWSVV